MLISLRQMAFCLKIKVMDCLTDESGDVNVVSIVVLIGIAVLLAVIFKDKISSLLDSLFTTIDKTATDAVTGE